LYAAQESRLAEAFVAGSENYADFSVLACEKAAALTQIFLHSIEAPEDQHAVLCEASALVEECDPEAALLCVGVFKHLLTSIPDPGSSEAALISKLIWQLGCSRESAVSLLTSP